MSKGADPATSRASIASYLPYRRCGCRDLDAAGLRQRRTGVRQRGLSAPA